MKPLLGATSISIEASDEQLVEWAKAGNSEAFAVLFRRYRPAIERYAGRILGDDARAEDIVQEVFLSALRSIGTVDRPAGFKPWLYRIAHNTCVDYMRRTRRAEEVSIDASLLPPNEEIRLFRQAPSTHAAVSQKEDFKNLREAFGGLPAAQSEMLVMRELEGLSYDEIALRLGVTRSSVESTLFRARQGLRDEYGQITTGERCLRLRPVMARMVAEGISGLRDRRALARHVRGCSSCRRDAYAMGLSGPALESPVPGVRGALSRVAALLPLPWLIHRRADETDAASSTGGGGGSLATQAQTAITNLTSSVGMGADQAATAIHKAVAVVAAVAVVGGSGYVASKSSTSGDLLLKDHITLPTRADLGPVVPSALRPLSAKHGASTTPAALGVGARPGGPGGPTGPATAVTSPLLPTGPSGVPGPIDTLGVPDAVAAPMVPEEPAAGGESPGDATAPDSTSGTDTTLPAAGDTSPPDSNTGNSGGGTDNGSSGGGGTGGGSGSGPITQPDGGTTVPDVTNPDPKCDLPKGLDKKDKIPPGWAKKCPGLEAAGTVP